MNSHPLTASGRIRSRAQLIRFNRVFVEQPRHAAPEHANLSADREVVLPQAIPDPTPHRHAGGRECGLCNGPHDARWHTEVAQRVRNPLDY